jgi:hypothetical protein
MRSSDVKLRLSPVAVWTVGNILLALIGGSLTVVASQVVR